MSKERSEEDLFAGQDDPESISRHHRKLSSDGGGDHKGNISFVPLFKHRAWHVLYRDMTPREIIDLFSQDFEIYGIDNKKSDLLKQLHEGWANNTDEKIKRTKAWYTLFADKTIEEIVEEVNNIWLDPNYEILVGMIRIKTIQLVQKQNK